MVYNFSHHKHSSGNSLTKNSGWAEKCQRTVQRQPHNFWLSKIPFVFRIVAWYTGTAPSRMNWTTGKSMKCSIMIFLRSCLRGWQRGLRLHTARTFAWCHWFELCPMLFGILRLWCHKKCTKRKGRTKKTQTDIEWYLITLLYNHER